MGATILKEKKKEGNRITGLVRRQKPDRAEGELSRRPLPSQPNSRETILALRRKLISFEMKSLMNCCMGIISYEYSRTLLTIRIMFVLYLLDHAELVV